MRLLLTTVFGLLAIEVTCLEKKQAFIVPKTVPEGPLAIHTNAPPLPHFQGVPLLGRVTSRKKFEANPPPHLKLSGVADLSGRRRPVRQDEDLLITDDSVFDGEEKTNATKIVLISASGDADQDGDFLVTDDDEIEDKPVDATEVVLILASGDPPQNFTEETTGATPMSPESLKQESSTPDSNQEVSKNSTRQGNPDIPLILNDIAQSDDETRNEVMEPFDDDSVASDAADLLELLRQTVEELGEVLKSEDEADTILSFTLNNVDGAVAAVNVIESKIAEEDAKIQTIQNQVTQLPMINTIQVIVQQLFNRCSNPGSYPVSVPQSHPASVSQQNNYPTYRSSNTVPVLLRYGRALELEMEELGGRNGGKGGATGQISKNSCLPVGDNSTTPQIFVCLSEAPRNSDLLENELLELKVQNVVKDYCRGQS